jgi:hypothetical protein
METMSSMKKFSRALYIGLVVLALAGCRQEGPAERAGKQLDEAVDDLTKPKGPAERAGEKLDKAVDDTGKALEDAGKKARKAVD